MLSLAAANGMLFSGGQDQTIRVWKAGGAAGGFECAAVLRAEHGGHGAPVSALLASGTILFSADFRGNLKVSQGEGGGPGGGPESGGGLAPVPPLWPAMRRPAAAAWLASWI